MAPMTLNLKKGMTLDLEKSHGTKYKLEAYWDPAPKGKQKIDVDICSFLMSQREDGLYHVTDEEDVIFFNNKVSQNRAVILLKDNTTGESEPGMPDEEMLIDTSLIADYITRLNLYIFITSPKIPFKEVKNAKVQLLNEQGEVLAVYNLTEDLTNENFLLMGAISRIGTTDRWKFEAKGQGYVVDDLIALLNHVNDVGSN